MRGLNNKTAIVSGGATLIGQGVAAVLVGYGMSVVVADIDEAGGAAAAAQSERIRFVRADVTRDDDVASLVATAVKTTGRLDFLVNVACTYLDNGADTSRADWLKALDVNLLGSIARPAAPCSGSRMPCA